jgi:DoxX-like family
MEIVRIVLSVLLALLLVVTGGGKVLGLPYAHANREKLSVHPVFWRITGALEIAAVVGLIWGIWFVPFGLAAAIGVALLMIGAFAFRLRTRDKAIVREGIADIVILVLAVVLIVLDVLAITK